MGSMIIKMISFPFLLVLGLLALPFLLVFNRRGVGRFLKDAIRDSFTPNLSDPDQRHRITFAEVETTPMLKARSEVEADVSALVGAKDWRQLSDRLTEWDQTRAACPAGTTLAHLALETALGRLAQQTFEGHSCHIDPIHLFDDDTAAEIETAAALHSEQYPLWALAAHMRCHQGWTARGADYARLVLTDNWDGMAQRFAKAAWLLDRFDPVEQDAPLLAGARHKLLGFMPDADKHFVAFYETWSDLDPVSQVPHEKHVPLLFPRWFGDAQTFTVEAMRAAARTSGVTGDAALFSMIARAMDAWTIDAWQLEIPQAELLKMDRDQIHAGAHDLIDLRDEDPAFVANLLERMRWWTAAGSDAGLSAADAEAWAPLAEGFNALRHDILRTRLKAIHGPSWPHGTDDAIFAISDAAQDDVQAGATFTLDERGLTVHAQAA